MIKHLVFLNVKKNLAKDEIAKEIKTRVEDLRHVIDVIVHIEVGSNYKDAPAGYDAAIYSEFNTKEDLQYYQDHPEHVKVRDFILEVTETRVFVDYETGTEQ